MENELKIEGAWICPDGKIHWTDNIQYHSKVIEELGIRKILQQKSKTIKWTSNEIINHCNLDLTEIAMKLGYIRVTSYGSSIGIESGIQKNQISLIQKKSLSIVYQHFSQKLYNEQHELIKQIVYEIFQRNYFQSFKSFFDFITSI